MSEKLYALLLKLYPDDFRRTYGDEALRLVRDRVRSERGFVAGLRLWLDLLLDLARSLPREYSRAPTTPILAAQPLNASFQLLAERSLDPRLLCLSGALSAVLLWGCVSVAAHSGGFPALLPFPLSLEARRTPAPAEDPAEEGSQLPNSARGLAMGDAPRHALSAGGYSLCMTARREIPGNSAQPLFAFRFARPGASGVARLDGKVVKVFQNEQRLFIRAHVFAGDHQFILRLDKPAENTFLSLNDDFEYCQAK